LGKGVERRRVRVGKGGWGGEGVGYSKSKVTFFRQFNVMTSDP
jgi:hypothetical protein